MSIKENIQLLHQRIEKAALAVGRDPREIKIIAAAKTQPIEALIEAIEAGITDFGENRVQEAEQHVLALKDKYPHLTWHMIGHLQTNKVKPAVKLFDVIQTVDSERLALEIQAKAQKKVPILIEVNASGENSKYGVSLDAAQDLIKKISVLPNLEIQGLMAMAPYVDDEKVVLSCFKRLKQLADKFKLEKLSMGMSDDFELAISQGSNIIRVGQAIFGTRGG